MAPIVFCMGRGPKENGGAASHRGDNKEERISKGSFFAIFKKVRWKVFFVVSSSCSHLGEGKRD